jgi:SAM-dependent methyltransferase
MRDWASLRGLVGPLNAADIADYYAYLIRTNFYSADYCTDWNPHPYVLMRNILFEIFGIRGGDTVVDIGCGAGFLVEACAEAGAGAIGYDFSADMLARAAERAHGRFRHIGAVDEIELKGARLVTMMEVMEHLPIAYAKDYLRHWSNFDGHLFLTIPSFGHVPALGRTVFQMDNASWIEDTRQGRYFRHVTVGEDPAAGGGHILLAAVQWWENVFHLHGLVRDIKLERRLAQFAEIFLAYKWCPYILMRPAADVLTPVRGLHAAPDGVGDTIGAGCELRAVLSGPGHYRLRLAGVCTDTDWGAEQSLAWSVFELGLGEDDQCLPHTLQSGVITDFRSGGFEVDIAVECTRQHIGVRLCHSLPAEAGVRLTEAALDLPASPMLRHTTSLTRLASRWLGSTPTTPQH